MNKYKVWILGFIFMIIAGMFKIGMHVYKVDPYQIYNYNNPSDEFILSRSMYIQRYLSLGLAKNMSYDTILVGSSMSENFKVSKINEILNCNSVKLSLSGGTPYEIKNMMKMAIDTRQVKTALVCIDTYMYNNEVNFHRDEFPGYLYDKNPFNDVKYLLNKSVIDDAKLLEQYNLESKESSYDLNNLYLDKDGTIYSYDKVIGAYDADIYSDIRDGELEDDYIRVNSYLRDSKTFKVMERSFKSNTLSIIKENPDIKFKLFYPPNSILFWNREALQQQHLMFLDFKKYIYEQVKELPNVELYDFQDIKEITFNLNYYKDSSHYSAEVCDVMLKRMADKTDMVTEENYLIKIENLAKQIQQCTLSEIKSYSK